MARVLISALGVGRLNDKREYDKSTYKFNNSNREYETSFVAAALSEHLKVDKIYLVGTCKSMWEEVYNYFLTESLDNPEEDYWLNLREKSSNFILGKDTQNITETDLERVNSAIDKYLQYIRSSATGGSHCFIIDYGINEEELWKNFDIFMRIGEYLEEGDEIYLDITHAFRSIPLFMFLMLDFIQTLNFKNIKLSGVYYGMLEAHRELGYAPVVNLGPFLNLSMWTRGVYNFVTYGNGYLIADLIDDRDFSLKLYNISELVNINYIKDLKSELDSLAHYLKQNAAFNVPVVEYIIPYLRNFVERFKGISSNGKFQFELAKWYFENNRYANGYICLAECIVTKVIEIYRAAGQGVGYSRKDRESCKKIIRNLQFNREIDNSIRKMSDLYKEINKIRNRIAHAGFLDGDNFKNAIKMIDTYIKETEKLVFYNKNLKILPQKVPFKKIKLPS